LTRMPAGVRFGVLEMGMNHAQEISHLTRMVRPHVAVITLVANAHIENFANGEQGIADAKSEIFEGLESGGTAVINRDNRWYAAVRSKAEASPAGRILTFGVDSVEADVRPLRIAPSSTCTAVTATVDGETLTFKIGMPGQHWVMNAMCVLAAVKAAGGDLGLTGLALAEMTPLKGRGRRSLVQLAHGEALVIDESYNANPASMRAALQVLGAMERKARARRIAVLGDMKELGAEAPALHAGLAGDVVDAGVDMAILVGDQMEHLAEPLARSLTVLRAHDAAGALGLLQKNLKNGDTILVKASNSMRLGAVVDGLLAEDQNAARVGR
jgi:UDP-N-acetylmuramoyl-tripeptide--D-alanyl-D-alanine ligase